jgi:hypothetical protein
MATQDRTPSNRKVSKTNESMAEKPKNASPLAPRPVFKASEEALEALRKQVRANLTKAPIQGALDTVEPIDPSNWKIQATTRMPGDTHRTTTFKLDKRLVGVLDSVSRKQNIAALVSYLITRGLTEVVREMEASNKVTTFHTAYETSDRNAFCGINDKTLLAMVRWVEEDMAKGDEPMGDIEVITDFLPPPAELAYKKDGVA